MNQPNLNNKADINHSEEVGDALIESVAQSFQEEIYQHFSKSKKSSSEQVKKMAGTALTETLDTAKKIMEMIHHFRVLGEDDSQTKAAPGKASIYDSVYQVLRAMQYEFPLVNITVLKILPNDLPDVATPKEHLEALLFQLVNRARASLIGKEKGIITIEAAEHVSLSPENKSAHRFILRVSDTGPSVAQQNIPQLLDPFAALEKQGESVGFGLYLVNRIVELNNGMIRVESSDRGTTFRVEFPI